MEKFFLSLFLTTDKLNIVHQKNISVSVFVSKSWSWTFSDSLNKFVSKIITLNIYYISFRMIFLYFITNGTKQVSFSKTTVTIKKKRIISTGWVLSNCNWSSMSKFIGWTYNESIKCKVISCFSCWLLFFFLNVINFLWNLKNNLKMSSKNTIKCII